MGNIKVNVHPLFFAFGIFYALTGRILVFVIYTVCAVVHELGHSYVADGCGYKLNAVTLMPFGAVVTGDTDGLKPKDEIKIALAGPIINLMIGLFFIAVWWVFPESYAFTDILVEASLSLAIVNFLPVFPLDGGRVLHAIIAERRGEKKAKIICKAIGICFSVLLAVAFVFSVFSKLNLSLLFFSLFVFFGVFSSEKENKYVKICYGIPSGVLKRGGKVNIVAVDKGIKLKELIRVLDLNSFNEVWVINGEEKIETLNQKRIEEIFKAGEFDSRLEKHLVIKQKNI